MFRILYCSDLHASEGTFRKLLNAVKLNVYGAQAVVIGGDLTGKAVLPVARRGDRYSASLLGEPLEAEGTAELEKLLRRIADKGFYPHVASPDEIEAMAHDGAMREEVFEQSMREVLERWIAMAEDRIGRSGVQFWMMPGNDDPFFIDDVIAGSTYVANPAGRLVDLDAKHQMLSFDYANPTPWKTHREWGEDEYRERILHLSEELGNPAASVFNIHVPPYDTGLDTAPLLDEELRPTVSAGDVLRGPVGSLGVREAIREVQPLIGMFGHIHESAGEGRLGRTVIVNPGSETESLTLKAHLIDLGDGKVERFFRIQG